MAVRVGAGGQQRELLDPRVGAGGQVRSVQEIRVGEGGQQRVVWFRRPLAAAAAADRWDRAVVTITPPGSGADRYTIARDGIVVADGPDTQWTDSGLLPGTGYQWTVTAHRAGEQVGAPVVCTATTPALSMAPMSATPRSTSQIDLSWSNPGGLDAVMLRDSLGGDQALAAGATSGSRTGLAAGTAYNFAVDGVRGSRKWPNLATASATTQAPVYQQKFWESRAAGSRTYNGSNADRGVAEMYYGFYSSVNGVQKSRFWFNIPADMRNCVSIDRIDLAFWGQHTYPNGGNQVYLAIIHDANNIGSTGALNWTFNVPKGGWVGPHDGSGWCIGLQDLTSPGRTSMAEEFRALGAVGFSLVATTTAQSGYGYCQGATQANYPRMRVWYTIRA